VLLLTCKNGFGTTLVVLVSGHAVVLGADGKGEGVRSADMKPVTTTVEEKVSILQNRFIVSTSGAARILRPLGPNDSKLIYDFVPWVKSIHVNDNASVYEVAEVIERKSAAVFLAEWKFLTRRGQCIPVMNLSDDPRRPWVQYYVAGNEFLDPKVYLVSLTVDYGKQRLNAPTITRIYPPLKNVTRFKNISVTFNAEEGGGIDQLLTPGSMVQKRYLKLYDKEVGAAAYDEPLDIEGLKKLTRIMLTLEIEMAPDRFSFPILICSSVLNQGPTCNSFDH
jgi:hypothetical protein